MSKRFKVEFVGINSAPFWFDTRKQVDDFIRFNQDCHVDDVPGGRVKLKITEYHAVKTEVI
jgi:hypothetical protein